VTSACVLPHRTQPERLRPTLPNTLVCRGCHDDLRSILIGEDRFEGKVRTRIRGLAELDRELEEAMYLTGTSGQPRTSGSREAALPFPPAIAGHRRDIADILGSWVLQHMADQPETGPGTIDPTITTRWLELRLGHAVRQDWIGDYAGELRQLRGRAHALLDPVRRTRFIVGVCTLPGCDGWLVADVVTNDSLLPSVIYCDRPADDNQEACGAEWPPHTWIRLGRALGKDQAA
jgi:hypothetical protein